MPYKRDTLKICDSIGTVRDRVIVAIGTVDDLHGVPVRPYRVQYFRVGKFGIPANRDVRDNGIINADGCAATIRSPYYLGTDDC